MNSRNFSKSDFKSAKPEQFIVGADVIAYLSPFKHPMIMVDRIVHYNSIPLSLIAEKYISANEPAFVGHFPNMKLWPGVYTLEGLRQCCFLLNILKDLEEADLLKGLTELQNRHMLRPQINHELCHSVIDYLKEKNIYDPDLYATSTKFLEPVFAGSLITYHCMRDENNLHNWSVKALVNDRLIAKGRIIQSFNVNS